MRLFLDRIFAEGTPGLEKMLDLSWRRNQVIASNVANAETPGYRASDLNFAGELKRAFGEAAGQGVSQTHAKHLDLAASGKAFIQPDLTGQTKADGNNVDIDIQMGQLSFNSGRYSSATRYLRKKLGMLKMAIRDGSR
jgi:flagellar basal-body rod protein FlgB